MNDRLFERQRPIESECMERTVGGRMQRGIFKCLPIVSRVLWLAPGRTKS